MNDEMIDFTLDKGNLYREESLTDLRAGAIRVLIPVRIGRLYYRDELY